MKRFIVSIIFVIVAVFTFNATAGNFKYRYPMEIGAEYSISRLHTGFEKVICPANYVGPLSSVGFNCFGLYASIGGSNGWATGYEVLGYPVYQNFTWYRFGFKVLNFEMGHSGNTCFSVTPFYSHGWTGMCDTSGNKIGWSDYLENRQRDIVQEKNTIGAKIEFGFALDRRYKLLLLNIGVIASPEEIGLTISLNFNAHSLCY